MMRGLSLSEQHQKLLLDRSRAGGMSMALLDPVLNINSTRGHCTSIRQDGCAKSCSQVLLTGQGLPTASSPGAFVDKRMFPFKADLLPGGAWSQDSLCRP